MHPGSSWIIDSGCTNHMTGKKRMFSSYEKNEDCNAQFVIDNKRGEKSFPIFYVCVESTYHHM
jgi:hypothetical protein